MRRFSSLIWNDQTALLVPCLAQKQATARLRTKREQTLEARFPRTRADGQSLSCNYHRTFMELPRPLPSLSLQNTSAHARRCSLEADRCTRPIRAPHVVCRPCAWQAGAPFSKHRPCASPYSATSWRHAWKAPKAVWTLMSSTPIAHTSACAILTAGAWSPRPAEIGRASGRESVWRSEVGVAWGGG